MTPLEKKHKILREKMLKVQSEYTQAVRKNTLSDAALRKLADKGFALEKKVLELWDKLQEEKKKTLAKAPLKK